MYCKTVLAATVFLAALPTWAQLSVPPADAANASAPAPQVTYDSVFKRYVPFREQPLASWPDVNEEVARAGGHTGIFGGSTHAGHSSEAASGTPPASTDKAAPASSAKPAASAPHSGHH
jgi:hypothetical protein